MSITDAIKSIFGTGWSFVRGFTAPPYPVGHKGIDISAASGTPVKSLAAGTVVYAENAAANPTKAHQYLTTDGGNVVVVEDASGFRYYYAHLSSFNVAAGTTVAYGQTLGRVGMTGNATGPHLHFAITDAQRHFIDPAPYLETLAQNIPQKEAQGYSLTFWKTDTFAGVTFPEGHVLTEADVNSIMDQLRAGGYFDNDVTGISQQGLRSLLTALIGRQWDDQLALDIQKGLGMGADEVAHNFNPLNAVPDLVGAITFIGIILVGVVFIILAGQVAKIKSSEE